MRKLHFIIHDTAGKSLIIEWIDGKMNLYEIKSNFCVLTNSPQYKQMETALSKKPYLNDITKSIERFKFLYNLLDSFSQANPNLHSYLIPASEIIERVASVKGEYIGAEGKYISTQFIILRDHKERKFYIKYWNELNYTIIDLKNLR